MALPRLSVPTYTLTVPSTKKKAKFRPFLSKEEKILMLVKQSESSEEILQAMKDIIDVCTFEKLDISKLALFDIEYIFLQLRAKSVGEVIDIDMKCNNQVDFLSPEGESGKRECGGIVPFAININDIEVKIPKEHKRVIKLEKDIGVTMRYPSVDDLEMLEANQIDDIEIIKGLIENVFDKDTVYEASETREEELQEFVDNMSTKHLEKIREEFFFTMPTVSHEVHYTCSKCGAEGEYEFSGVNDFF